MLIRNDLRKELEPGLYGLGMVAANDVVAKILNLAYHQPSLWLASRKSNSIERLLHGGFEENVWLVQVVKESKRIVVTSSLDEWRMGSGVMLLMTDIEFVIDFHYNCHWLCFRHMASGEFVDCRIT